VVAVVTKPFAFEGAQRNAIAERGFQDLKDRVDTIITIPNDKILHMVDKKTPLLEAFGTVDDVLRQGVQGISELITIPGLINVDFNDVKAVMQDAGSALMGIGEASGEGRSMAAAKMAISSPLLDLSIDGARGILFIIVGGPSMAMSEVEEAATIITESVDPNAKIIFGAVIDEDMKDKIRITVVAAGFGDKEPRHSTSFDDSKYSINRLFSKKNLEEKIEEARGQQRVEPRREELPQPAPRPIMPSASVPAGQFKPKSEDEDLEIPAFIRKKMK